MNAPNSNKSVRAWLKEIDLAQYQNRPFVVVDPADSSSLLYLNNKEYQRLLITSLSNDGPLMVIAKPGQLDIIVKAQAEAVEVNPNSVVPVRDPSSS